MPFDAARREKADAVAATGDAFNAASRSLQKMETLLVRLTSDEGTVGWGEAFGHLINPVTFAALAGPVGKFFIGAEVTADPASFAHKMTAAHQAFHAFGRTGPVLYALSAIDIALWDLCAQAAGQPLHRLLGATRDTIDVYASLVSYDNDPDELAYQVKRTYDVGFRRMKLHETAPGAIAAARRALPPDAALMVDVNCPWSREEAAKQVAELKGLSLGWVEEPIWPPDDLDGLAALRALGVPLAAGENASGVQGFAEHFKRGAIDVAQPSITKIGGVSGMLEVIRLAKAQGVAVVPHCFYYGAGMMAAAHVVATLPDDVALEVPWLQWSETLCPQQAFGPSLHLSGEAGLGYHPDASVLGRHTITSASIR